MAEITDNRKYKGVSRPGIGICRFDIACTEFSIHSVFPLGDTG